MALILLRHGESIGNVAREAAESSGLEQIPLESRDADIPLSNVGIEQAQAVGRELARTMPGRGTAHIWSSPYRRARQTAELVAAGAGLTSGLRCDERLRDRELGILDTLTSLGMRNRFPAEAARRALLGKFYYRPPGGESWADVALRLRTFLPSLTSLEHDVYVVTHDAVIAVCRYILEDLDERGVLDLAAREPIGNASISRCSLIEGTDRWRFDAYNEQHHLTAPDGTDLRTTHPGERDVHPR
jgi:broad specificity phosphatase PhoE